MHDREVLERAEVGRMLAACRDAEERAVFLLAYDLALRAGEVERIRNCDVDMASKTVRVRSLKRRDHREVREPAIGIGDETAKAIRPFVRSSGDGPVFAWPPARVEALVRCLATAAGLPGGPAREGGKGYSHILRRSRASHLLDDGADPKEVQRRLRHASMQTTFLYWGLSASRRVAADDRARSALASVLREGGAAPGTVRSRAGLS